MRNQILTQNKQDVSVQETVSLLLGFAKELRTSSCLSQAQLASIMGLRSHGNINAIETGKIYPRLDTFLRILSVFDYRLVIVRQDTTTPAPIVQSVKLQLADSADRKAASEQEAIRLLQDAKKIRQNAGVSQQQLASMLGLKSHGNINAIEVGKVFPRIDSFLRYLAALQYTVAFQKKENFNDQLGH